MPLGHYGVLKGRAVKKLNSTPGHEHFQIEIEADGTLFRIAVNVQSQDQPPDLLYYLDANFKHPMLAQLVTSPVGFTLLPGKPAGIALDFIRSNLFSIEAMKILPDLKSGPSNDLNDLLDLYVDKAIRTEGTLLYAFGERWGPEENKPDQYFQFQPGNGIHDIHMNQGNSGQFAKDNGIYQDGGLLIYYPEENVWVALFLRFQSQAIHTDDVTGAPVSSQPPPDQLPVIRIVAALVNPAAKIDQGEERLILFNPTNQAVNLQGWAILDKQKNRQDLSGPIAPGEMKTILLPGNNVLLSNQGGIITLVNEQALKIHGVAYTRDQAQHAGFWILF